jgi:co-chaperonin GroES (HSP10)|tara:strand:+ start:402 stop:788 length:387 start_codon:yes stop_codon:yes gene_type:complete
MTSETNVAEIDTDQESQNSTQMPEPSGYKILIALPDIEEATEGGIIKAEETRYIESVATIVGFVLKTGPDCYKDQKRFPSGPWCKEGDFILMRTYTGTRFKIHGKEFRLINDDSVEAVVDDPRGYERL